MQQKTQPPLEPTPELVDQCGDRLLMALLFAYDWKTAEKPEVGDLAIEASSFRLDWERVGYLTYVSDDEEVYKLWTIAEREVTWRNASFRRLGRKGLRLPKFPFPGEGR
jgi:hypothetical protein